MMAAPATRAATARRLVDTDDGLAKHVYIREAAASGPSSPCWRSMSACNSARRSGCRRGRELRRQHRHRLLPHRSASRRPGCAPTSISRAGRSRSRSARWFRSGCDNLLPANKNIGMTHITNGCYRLHPVEWNIGEAAGAVAAWSLARDTHPSAVRNDEHQLRAFQDMLVARRGIQLRWPEFGPPA